MQTGGDSCEMPICEVRPAQAERQMTIIPSTSLDPPTTLRRSQSFCEPSATRSLSRMDAFQPQSLANSNVVQLPPPIAPMQAAAPPVFCSTFNDGATTSTPQWSAEINRPKASMLPSLNRYEPPSYGGRRDLDNNLALAGLPRWISGARWQEYPDQNMQMQPSLLSASYSSPIFQKGDGYGSGDPRIRYGRSGGAWRHIRSCYESGGSFITWVDGAVKSSDVTRCPPFGDCTTLAMPRYSNARPTVRPNKPVTSSVALKNAGWVGPFEAGR